MRKEREPVAQTVIDLEEVSWSGDGARGGEMVAREGGREGGEAEKSEKAWNLTPPSDDCRGGSGAATDDPVPPAPVPPPPPPPPPP